MKKKKKINETTLIKKSYTNVNTQCGIKNKTEVKQTLFMIYSNYYS